MQNVLSAPKFTAHLTGMSRFSPLMSLLDVKDAIKLSKELGLKAIGLTDYNNLYGLFKFYQEAKKSGLKPIVGSTLNVCLKDHKQHEDNPAYSIHILVKSEEGYHRLNQLITLAQTEGKESGESDAIPKVYYKHVLEQTDDLIVLSGGYDGMWNTVITSQGTIQGTHWEDMLVEFKNAFGDDFYMEIQDHSVASEMETNVELLTLSQKYEINMVMTHSYKYKKAKDAFAKEVVNAIKSKRTVNRDLREYVFENYDTLDFATDVKFREFLKDGNEFYFKSPEEMESHNLTKFFPELLTNIDVIIDKCNLELNLDNPELPSFPLPEGFNSDEEYFNHLIEEGFEKRLPNIIKRRDVNRFPDADAMIKHYRERLEFEKNMINKMGFPGYFLVVWDVCRFAREEGIFMAPGRGSVAGSLVSFALEITGIDPIAKDLLFERFLNPARVSMPDIDLDFDSLFRSKILDYTYNKYGREYVAQIIAFTNLAAKPAVKDVAKVLNLFDTSVNNSQKYSDFSDYISKFMSPTLSIEGNLENSEELQDLASSSREVDFLLEIAKTVEGSIKTTSMHAGGVVIGKQPISKYVPSQKAKAKEDEESDTVLEGVVIQADKKACEPLGLIKMDYLATAILSKVRLALTKINKKRKKLGEKPIDFYELSDYVQYTTAKEDPKMYEPFQSGKTQLIFQCENPALGNVLTQFYPESFEDVTAILALYRPGPMANIPTYISNKNNPDEINYMHKDLEPVLKETFGIIVYQEQIMQLVQVWAGFSLAEADLIRRAIGKKEKEVLKKEGEKFVNKAVEMGRDKQLSEHIYSLIVKFAEYGFNKSHAAAYAVLALVTAWLKAYYPLEYTAEAINSFSTSSQKPVERISNYIFDLIDMGYEVLPPSVNASEFLFTLEDEKLRHGLFSIKGAQERAVKRLVNERFTNGLYTNMSDFFTRNTLVLEDEEKGFKVEGLDKSTIQSLSITGAFDEIRGEVSQKSIFEEASKVADFYKKSLIDSENRKRDDQLDLFKAMGDNFFDEESIQYNFPTNVVDYNWKEVMSNELDKMRLSYAVKPEDHISKIANKVAFRSDFEQLPFVHSPSQKNPHLYELKEDVTCYGMVRAKRKIRNNTICFITFRDHTGIIETTFFMDAYKKYKFFLEENENAVLVFKGKLQRTTYGKTGHESNIYNMNVNDVWTLDHALQDPTLLNDVNVRKIEQQSARSIQQPKASAPALTSLNEQYNVAHIKVANDLELKQALRQFFVEKDSPSKDTKVVIHNYLQPNVKTDVVVVNNFTLSLEDIKGLIANGTLNKRDVIITPKQLA